MPESKFVKRLDECYKHYHKAATDITNPDYDPETFEYYRGKAHCLMIAREALSLACYFRDRYLAEINKKVSSEQ